MFTYELYLTHGYTIKLIQHNEIYEYVLFIGLTFSVGYLLYRFNDYCGKILLGKVLKRNEK